MKRKIRILWIEDNLNTAIKEIQDAVKEIIEESFYKAEIIDVEEFENTILKQSEKSGMHILNTQHIDLIFSDNHLPNGKEGVDFFSEIPF